MQLYSRARLVTTKRTIKAPRGCHINKKAERRLLNEHIRSINSTLKLYKYQRGAYISHLREALNQRTMEECQELIKSVLEARHNKVLEYQRAKYEKPYEQRTGGCSNSTCNYGGGHSNSPCNCGSSKLGTMTNTTTPTTTST